MAYVPDAVRHVKLSTVTLPLSTPISDAKVFTGRQKPMTEVVFLFAEIATEQGHAGLGFSYSKRAGGPAQYAHAKEVAQGLIGEDPNDIARVYTKLLWAGASVGRSGVATQALAAIDIALYDLKAKRAGLPLAKLLGAHRDSVRTYNTSGGFLNASLEEVKDRATRSLEEGIGGIKIKVGLPDSAEDLHRELERLAGLAWERIERAGVAGQLGEHPGHGGDDRQPEIGPPGPVDPHADQEDDQLAVVLVGHPTGDDGDHGAPLDSATPQYWGVAVSSVKGRTACGSPSWPVRPTCRWPR